MPAPPVEHPPREQRHDLLGDGTGIELRLGGSGWVWQRYGGSVAEKREARGVTVHARSSVAGVINRRCTSYDAHVGVDVTLGHGKARFSVHGGAARPWKSGLVDGGDARFSCE